MLISMTSTIKDSLRSRGVESFHGPTARVSGLTTFEPPCSIKWMQIENRVHLGAFSYAVSGYYSEVHIGRYVSIGEQVQIGRANHALTWVSTSPFFYLREKLFNVGNDFSQSDDFDSYLPPSRPGAKSTDFRQTVIGNDVYIGHGAMVMPGVKIGDGAVVGAMSVVTKDVPSFGIVAGNPARLIRMRHPPQVVASLLKSAWWRYAPWQLSGVDCSCPEKASEALEEVAQTKTPYAPATFKLQDITT